MAKARKDVHLRAVVADQVYTFVYQVIPKVVRAAASTEKYQLTFPQSRYALFGLGQQFQGIRHTEKTFRLHILHGLEEVGSGKRQTCIEQCDWYSGIDGTEEVGKTMIMV